MSEGGVRGKSVSEELGSEGGRYSRQAVAAAGIRVAYWVVAGKRAVAPLSSVEELHQCHSNTAPCGDDTLLPPAQRTSSAQAAVACVVEEAR